MNRVRIFAVLVIALTAGGALAFGTYNYLQNVPVQTVSLPTRPVVVAAADLSLGAEIRSDDLRVVQWPEGSIPEGSFGQPGDLLGRGVIATIVRHEPILPAKLAPVEGGTGLPAVIPPGMRAVSVRVNEVIGVAGYVLPGTRVDVLATASPSRSDEMTTKLILPNVQVLTAGTRMEQDVERGTPMQVTVVTLLVTPPQSEHLALASTEGKIQLALRNPLDQDEPDTPGVRPAAMLGGRPAPAPRPAASPAPPPPPPPPPVVEIIRGDQRANEVVQ